MRKIFILLVLLVLVPTAIKAQNIEYYYYNRPILKEQADTIGIDNIDLIEITKSKKAVYVSFNTLRAADKKYRYTLSFTSTIGNQMVTIIIKSKSQKGYELLKSYRDEIYRNLVSRATSKHSNSQITNNFTAPMYIGDSIQLSNFRGKVVLVTFWGSWCKPCLMELQPENYPKMLKPFMQRNDFVLIPIAEDSKESLDKFFGSTSFKKYLWLKNITAYDSDKSLLHIYATSSIPRSILIDRDGFIIRTFVGSCYKKDDLKEVSTEIKNALNSK